LLWGQIFFVLHVGKIGGILCYSLCLANGGRAVLCDRFCSTLYTKTTELLCCGLYFAGERYKYHDTIAHNPLCNLGSHETTNRGFF
jgi:hypothetical protein